MNELDWSRWQNFERHEFECPCCGRADMDIEYMDLMQRIRTTVGFAIRCSSGFRCTRHNKAVGGSRDSAHKEGRGGDYIVAYMRAYEVARVAFLVGMTGIGVAQKGAGRYLHLDSAESIPGRRRRPTIWSY